IHLEEIEKFNAEIAILEKQINDNSESDKKEILEQKKKNIENKKNKWMFSSTIKDQAWFIWSWHKDPTVKSMLVMLDDIESRIDNLGEEQRNNMWNRLGQIVFHLLPLEQFNLTDELYVKMNARGKELSQFDILKSTFEEQMRINTISETIRNNWLTNFDSHWIDIFWNKIAKPRLKVNGEDDSQQIAVKEVENSYLRFLKRMIVFHLYVNDDCLSCNWNAKNIKRYVPFEYSENDNILNKLRDFSTRNDVLKLIPLFSRAHFFNSAFFEFIEKSLKSFIYEDDNSKKDGSCLINDIGFEHSPKSLFEAFVAKDISFDTRVQFYALIEFLKYNYANDIIKDESKRLELNSWMRVIRNLSTNTNTYFYNGYDDFLKSLQSIKKWTTSIYKNNKSTILRYLADDNLKLDGFDGSQLEEERIKAKLMLKPQNWLNIIRKAEEHNYFLGQIGFLLNWSKNESDKYNVDDFDSYYTKICNIFNENGLVYKLKEQHLFKNSLMCTSDWYLLNNCFIKYDNNKDRDWSWKRYLRESKKSINIKKFIDNWNQQDQSDFIEFNKNFIELNKPSDWRKYFIEYPKIYDVLIDKKISWWHKRDKEICLLSKTRWSSKHKELRTFYWYLKFKETKDKYLDSTEETHPFSGIFYRGDKKEFSIKYIPKWDKGTQQGQYVVSSNFNTLEFGMQKADNGRWEKYFDIDSEDIETLLEKLHKTE
nr:hypothetical protein [Bacteroidales bacterium]